MHVAIRIEALGALAHDDQIHRPPEPRAAACRTHVRVKVELHAERGRDVDAALLRRGIVEMRDRAEDHAVHFTRSREDAVGQRRSLGFQRGETDVALLVGKTEAEAAVGYVENRQRRGRDLRSDAVAGEYEEFHQSSLPLSRLQSSLIPAALITRAYLSSSARTNAANSSGLLPTGSVESCLNLARTSGSFRIATSSPFRRRTMSLGVPAGACIEYQAFVSYCGRPASAKVGTSGYSGERFGAESASALSLPPRTCGMAEAAVSSMACTRPAIRSTSAGPPPL